MKTMNVIETQIISISMPINHNGRVIGVIGTNFIVRELSMLIATYSIYGDGKLVSDRGIYAVYHDMSRIGTQVEQGNREILDQLPLGRMFDGFWDSSGENIYKVFVPVQLGIGTPSWYFAMEMPQREIYQSARQTVGLLIIFCIVGIVLIALAGLVLIRAMLKGVIDVTKIINKLSLGNINLKIENDHGRDEIGTMKHELGRLIGGLKDTATFAHDIGDGNFNSDYSKLSDDDVLGNALLDMRQSLQDAATEQAIRAKEEEHRNWGTAGLAKFAEILRRDNTNLEALSYNVISNMVKYIDANQGGIFVMNDSENESERVLELKACYAFDRKKHGEKAIKPGEGLVGACYLEGESIYMTEVPNSYINITSGLGDANPKAVLICPLKVNDEIYGVIELASFEPFEEYKLDFVQKVSESIASTISTVRVNIRTERLLAQTKMQTEEMANAEEELRQNMEEMQATQEESRRREIELNDILAKMQETQTTSEENKHSMEQFYDGIFATNNVIEFSSDGVITNVNQNLCALFGLDKSAFIDKPMSAFVGEETTNQVMSNMRSGKLYETVQQVNAGNRTLTIKQKFMPIISRESVLQSVMLLAFHDQEEELRQNMEELQAQEEELRQNMEEMLATQEEQRRNNQELELARSKMEEAVTETQNQLTKSKLVMKSANVGGWDIQLKNGDPDHPDTKYIWSDQLRYMLEYSNETDFPNTADSWSNSLHSEDKERVFNLFNSHIFDRTGKTPYDVNYRMRTKNGVYKHFHDFAETIRNSEGYAVRMVGALQDITEWKNRETELQEILIKSKETEFGMKQFHEGIFSTNNVVEFSPNGNVTEVNQNFCDMFGINKSAIIGKNVSEFISKEVFKSIEGNINSGKVHTDVQLMTIGATTKSVIQKYMPIFDNAGNMLRVLLLAFPDDTAELRKIEEKLRTENHEQLIKLNLTMEVAEIGLWDMLIVKGDPVNPNNAFTWSDGFRRLLGYSNEADFPNVTSSWSDKLHPEDKDRTLNAFAAHILDRTGKTPYNVEYRLLKKCGEYGWFKAFGKTTRDSEGYAISVAGGIKEITKEKEYLMKIEESQKIFEDRTHWYEFMLDAMNHSPISVTDMNKNITFMNKAALTILGKTQEEVLGKNCGDIWGVDICKDERCGIEFLKCGKGKSMFNVGDSYFTTLASYIVDLEGNNIGHIEVVEDITETMKIKKEIQKLVKLGAADVGTWEMQVQKGDPANPNNTFTWSDSFRRLLGYTDEADFPNVLKSWSDKLHPEDKEKVLSALAAHLLDKTGKTPFDLECRLLKKSGEYGWFKAFGETARDAQGYAISVAGGIKEITKDAGVS